MAKSTDKKKSWGINLGVTADAAKSSIQETTHRTEKKKPGPKGQGDVNLKRIVIHEDSQKLLKRMASDEDTTMIEFISEMVKNEWERRNQAK